MKGRKINQFHLNSRLVYRLASGSGATILMQIILWPSIEVEILLISILLYLHHSWSDSTYQERKWHTMWKKWDEGRGWSYSHLWNCGGLSSTVKYTGAKAMRMRACTEVLLLCMAPNYEMSEVLWCCFMFKGVWFCTLLSQFSNRIYLLAKFPFISCSCFSTLVSPNVVVSWFRKWN